MTKVPAQLRVALLATATAIAGGGAYITTSREAPEVLLAMDLGAYYESSNKHIGVPYIDKVGKGQPWTVCDGVTGPEVVPGRYYTKEECKKLELPKYRAAAALAKSRLKYWDTYNIWVKASLVDTAYNVPSALAPTTTLVSKANAGDLIGMCRQMPRWVYGTVNGKQVRLPGLVDRTGAREELCAEWGRDGHFSVGLL